MRSDPQAPTPASVVTAEQTSLQIPSQPEWIAPTVEFLKERAVRCGACHLTRAKKLMLALHEALTNSIIHGNLELPSDLKDRSDHAFAEALAQRAADPHYSTRTVDVRVEDDGEHCHWAFTDQGKGFDVEAVLARAAALGNEKMMLASGRGIVLMRALLDDVRYELNGRRTILTLARPLGEEKRCSPYGPAVRPDDRRLHPRAAYTARLTIEIGPDQPSALGFGRDLSPGGISFLTSTPLPLANVTLILPQSDRKPLRVRAHVIRCHQLLSGIYDVAARFLDVA